MNYKTIALQEFINLSNEHPDYTLAQTLYSFLRTDLSGIKEVKEIKNLSDEELYSIIEQAIEIENDK